MNAQSSITPAAYNDYLDALMNEIAGTAATLDAPRDLSRRGLLKITGVAGGGLVLAFCIGGPGLVRGANAAAAAKELKPNAFVQISPSGSILIYSKNPEIGQGIKTAHPMIVAEELDAAWSDVVIEQSPVNSKVYGPQMAGGSTSIPRNWDLLRQAGAGARAMLVSAAAKDWRVPEAELRTEASMVIHEASGRRAKYGDLAAKAAALPVPDVKTLKLKTRDQYRLLGTRIGGVDNLKVVTGQPLFGIDQNVPGMVYATYTKCPAFGGKVASANLDHVKSLPGVKDAFILEGNGNPMELMPGVAILADSTWSAFKARSALQVTWDESGASKDSWSSFMAKAQELSTQDGKDVVHAGGDVDQAFANAPKRVKASYTCAFLPHAPLEPQNCTASFHDGVMEIWAPSQAPEGGLKGVAKLVGLPEDKVIVHQTRIGGGFGRRLVNDYMVEVAAIAMRAGTPVKLQWTREDDTRHDFYRAGRFHHIEGALDSAGKLVGWKDHLVTFTADNKAPVRGGAVGAEEFPLPLLANAKLSQTMLPLAVPCSWWRAPGANVTAFAVQSFIHELAVAAGRDHVEFLLEIMGPAKWLKEGQPGSLNTGRAAAVIKLAAEKAGWGRQMPAGHGLGLAFHFCHLGHFAHVAEVSVDANQKLRLHKVTVAGDMGPIVNMSGAEHQIQGSVIDGYSSMWGGLTIEDGRVIESNFDQYPILRIADAPPVVDVHFIQSDFPPTGAGEPAFPPTAPAIANAIFAATGRRVRSLPLRLDGFTV